MKRSVVMWMMVGLFSLAWAQLDPKAAPFLDYGQALKNPVKPETIAYTICFTVYDVGKAQPEACMKSALDFVGRRLATHTTIENDVSTMIYQNGQLRVKDFFADKPQTLPAAQAKGVEKTFDLILQGNFLPDHFERTSYDGPVHYGKVIRGEQVSVTASMPDFNSKNLDLKPTTTRLIFDKNKRLLGTVGQISEGEMLSVFNNPSAEMTFALFFDATIYRLEGDKPILMSKSRLVGFRLNKPLDEKLFTFGTDKK